MRISDLTREIKFTTAEVRRHVTRLSDVALIRRDLDGYYQLTPYGETSLLLFQEFIFLSSYRNYFKTHILSNLPTKIVKQIGELQGSTVLTNAMDFFRQTEKLIKESKEYVWLLVDQFPLNSLASIIEAIERGVQFRVIEPRERVLNPDIESMTSEESQAMSRTKSTPQVNQRMVEDVKANLYLSDNQSVIAFQKLEGGYDYTGFRSKEDAAINWCRDLFLHYWDDSANRTPSPKLNIRREQFLETDGSTSKTVLTGSGRPEIDAQLLQKAIDNYDEVVLKGWFNVGTSTININRSVIIRGDGRTEGIPDTKIRKKGWIFPFTNYDNLFLIYGEDIDVTIENIHVEDFNGLCFMATDGNNFIFRKNRITLESALGRGFSTGTLGDRVSGINLGGGSANQKSSFKNILIEDNYLDFALLYSQGGGFISNTGPKSKPEFRPDLMNHETPVCFGININRSFGKVIIRNNTIRNMSARGIVVFDNWDSSDIEILNNTIISEDFGAYYLNGHMSGVGIFVQSTTGDPRKGGRIRIEGNRIDCDKVNYCGIAVYGQAVYIEGAGKLEQCLVKNNDINLDDGSVGVIIRKNDNTIVSGNTLTGNVYYGVHLWGSRDREGFDLSSSNNVVRDNDLSGLSIKKPDYYSDDNADDRLFAGANGKSETAFVWLNKYSIRNEIHLNENESYIDGGRENEVIREQT